MTGFRKTRSVWGRARFALAILSVTGAGLMVACDSWAAGSRLAVLGFQSDGSAPRLIDRSASSMTVVGVDGINLLGAGRVSIPDQSQLVQRAASAVAQDVLSGTWNGVSVDIESLAPRDTAGLTQLVALLRAELPANDSVTVCVEAFTSPAAYRANGYDLTALAGSANQIVLMTYDDHGPWENTPGPIGPLRWQRASVHALESAVPADHVFLGAADYGYAWRPHANDNLNVAQARALVARWHARPHWIAAAGEWTATLRDGSTVWWSDRRSVALRIKLARVLGVYGVAIWSLGSGDPIPAAG